MGSVIPGAGIFIKEGFGLNRCGGATNSERITDAIGFLVGKILHCEDLISSLLEST